MAKKKKTAKKKATRKKKAAKKKAPPTQQYLSDSDGSMAPPVIKAIEDAAMVYRMHLKDRLQAQTAELNAQAKLTDLLKEHELKSYKSARLNFEAYLPVTVEKAKVRDLKKDKEEKKEK